MKIFSTIVFTIFTTVILSCSGSDNEIILERESLTQNQISNLLFLIEEEKLARDVYLFSFEKYGNIIFNNIAKSEQQHMNQVLSLMDLYKITNTASTEIGIFNNIELQNLYKSLIEKSAISLTAALQVGATIEDLDINDIENMENGVANSDFLTVFANLKCGSRNHLRNYYNQLIVMQQNYEPQFISLEEFTEIVQSPNEKCGLAN